MIRRSGVTARLLNRSRQCASENAKTALSQYFFKRPVNEQGVFFMKDKQMKRDRPDKDGAHRGAFEKNKKKIYATHTVCGICGKPVDFSLKYPHPLAPCIDHIIPIARGGHPSDLDNLQLAHWTCNRQKSDKLIDRNIVNHEEDTISNRMLPQSIDWTKYRA